jgi:ribosomal protein S18 acetylase RimI-like enzyme
MTALTQSEITSRKKDGLKRTNLARDLYQIAELIEKCFSLHLDASGNAAVQEMKTVAQIWPIVWLMTLTDRWLPGANSGYVWRSEERVVGNVSLYPGGNHPWLGQGWLIANVAVHPDYRRQGIAMSLMEASLDLLRNHHSRWAALQVEADNESAIHLYKKLGFQPYETLGHWERTGFQNVSPSWRDNTWPVRLRESNEIAAEVELIFQRARTGAMAWTQPIEHDQIWDRVWDNPLNLLKGQMREHWVLDDPQNSQRLLGALWVDMWGWRAARLSLFLDPELQDSSGRQALLQRVLTSFKNWGLRAEVPHGDTPVEEILREAGFSQIRSLLQMRMML